MYEDVSNCESAKMLRWHTGLVSSWFEARTPESRKLDREDGVKLKPLAEVEEKLRESAALAHSAAIELRKRLARGS